MFSRFAIVLVRFRAVVRGDGPGAACARGGVRRWSQGALVEQLLALDDNSASTLWTGCRRQSVVPIWSGADGHLLAIVAVPGAVGFAAGGGHDGAGGSGKLVSDGRGRRWIRADCAGRRTTASMSMRCSVRARACCLRLCGVDCDSRTAGRVERIAWSWLDVSRAVGSIFRTGFRGCRAAMPRRIFQGFGAGVGVPVLTLPEAMSLRDCSRKRRFLRAAAGVSTRHRARYRRDLRSRQHVAVRFDRQRAARHRYRSAVAESGRRRRFIAWRDRRPRDAQRRSALIGKKWTALDLGVSWRTPWRAEISVGAQNLWSAPMDAPRDTTDPSQARTPYIQYRQDL